MLEPEVVPYGPPTTTGAPLVAAPTPRRDEEAAEDGTKAALGLAVPLTPSTTIAATTTTVAAAAQSAQPAPSTTTTTAPTLVSLPAALTPVAPTGRGSARRTDRGKASWFHAPDGTCAHTWVPKGTEIRVTRVSTGASTTCIVDDWGPADESRIIDLSLDTFEQLASPDAGVIDVTIEW